jgi:hypothetical protein
MRLLFLPRSPVDFEHMLPFIQLIQNELPQLEQKFCFLNVAYDPYINKDISDWCPRDFELSPANFISNSFVRWVMNLIYAGETFIRCHIDIHLSIRIRQSRVHRFGYLWEFLSAAIKNTQSPDFDVIFISENNAGAILLKKNWHLFHSICDANYKRVLIIPESYDSYYDENEFNDYLLASQTRNFKVGKLLLGRINKSYLPKKDLFSVGVPRYSRWWTEVLLSKANNHVITDFPASKTVLYLAQKRRDWDPVYSKVQDEIDEDLWQLLKDNPDLHLIIKPHPKSNCYRGMKFSDDIKDRILVVEDVSTLALSKYSSMVVSVWTSIIPCFLHLGVPVVLLRTEEAGRTVQPDLKRLCGDFSELQLFAQGHQLAVKENTQQQLNVFFESEQENYMLYLKARLIEALEIEP